VPAIIIPRYDVPPSCLPGLPAARAQSFPEILLLQIRSIIPSISHLTILRHMVQRRQWIVIERSSEERRSFYGRALLSDIPRHDTAEQIAHELLRDTAAATSRHTRLERAMVTARAVYPLLGELHRSGKENHWGRLRGDRERGDLKRHKGTYDNH
jgi:hypothetical protein